MSTRPAAKRQQIFYRERPIGRHRVVDVRVDPAQHATVSQFASCHADELIRRESTRADWLVKMLSMAVTLTVWHDGEPSSYQDE